MRTSGLVVLLTVLCSGLSCFFLRGMKREEGGSKKILNALAAIVWYIAPGMVNRFNYLYPYVRM